MLRAILFDFNGVLVDDEPVHARLLARVLTEEGVPTAIEEARERFLGRPDRSCFATALADAGQSVEPLRLTRLITRKAAYYREEVRRAGYPFFPGAADLVRSAAAGGVMLGVVTGALREEVEAALGQAGLRDLFKVLITAEDASAGKPDPEPYLRALEQLNVVPPLPESLVHPHQVLAIEDTPAGLEAAAAAGLVTLGIAQSLPRPRLAAADLVADRLEGLSLARLQALYAEVSRR